MMADGRHLVVMVQEGSKPKASFHILSLYAKYEVPNLSTWVTSAVFGIEFLCG